MHYQRLITQDAVYSKPIPLCGLHFSLNTWDLIYFAGLYTMGPVFRQTGHKYSSIDLALIEISAYSPRKLLRSVPASPEEAVEMDKAVGAKAILGMHWGTIELSEKEAFDTHVVMTTPPLKKYREQHLVTIHQ